MKKNKLRVICTMLAGIFIFSLISCAPRVIRRPRRNKDTSLARVEVRKKLIVGVKQYFPPFVSFDDNNVTGFDVDVAKEVAKRMNIDIEFRALSWTQMYKNIQDSEVDCLWGALDISAFSTWDTIFSDKYLNSSLATVTLVEIPFTSLEELKVKTVGLVSMADSATGAETLNTILAEIPQLILYHDLEAAISDLKSKRIDVVITDVFTAFYLTVNDSTLKMIKDPIKRQSYAVVFSDKDKTLRDKINDVLLQLEYEGVLETLSRKWFGSNIVIIGR